MIPIRRFNNGTANPPPIPMVNTEALIEAANGGDVDSQYQLGLIYLYGNQIPKDASKAFEWFSRASGSGHVPAKRELGILLASGEGCEPDPERAAVLLGEASDDLDPGAMYHLALMLEKGIGIPADLQRSMRLMAYAASMGYPGADVDAERIYNALKEERDRKLRARPILKLQLSDVDVEAACCKRMLDELLAENIVFTDSMKGPALLGEDSDGMDTVFFKCPFCGKPIQIIPHDTVF